MPRSFVLALGALFVLILGTLGGTAYALTLENRNDFCASCHTQPETAYVQRTHVAPPVDLTSAHVASGVRCIDCHSGAGPFGRKDGLIQGAQDVLKYISGAAHQPALTTHSLPDANCVQCHTTIFATKSLKNHYHFYLPDWQAKASTQAAQCISCHTSHTTGNSRVVSYAFDTKVNPYCAACHTFSGIR